MTNHPIFHAESNAELQAELNFRTTRLESAFLKIQHERMEGIPILNSALQVKALGFAMVESADLETMALGILLTPWFMNLILLPLKKILQPELVGQNQSCKIGDNRFQFIYAIDDDIGTYQMCSLFSPVFEFADQSAACSTALAVLDQLRAEMQQQQRIAQEKREMQPSRRAFLRGQVVPT